MSEPDLEDIERILGHNADPQRRGAIQDLYDVPLDLLEDARELRSTILSYRLLRYYTDSHLWRWLPEFIDDVLERGVELQAWVRGGFIFPLFSLDTLVTLDVAQILSVLEPDEDESWFQVAPEWDAWEIQESATGAPAVKRPQLRYDWESPEHVRRVMISSIEHLLEVDDIVIATRRWIASRIARRTLKLGGIESFTNPETLFDCVFQGVPYPSNDTLTAISGFLQETRMMGLSKVAVPGFRGPSDWYR